MAPRFVPATTMKQSNAVRFSYPTPWHAPSTPRFSYSTTMKQSNAVRFSYSTTVKQSNAARFTYSNEWHVRVCVALGYIAIVELLRRAAFHAFRGMA